MNYNKKNIIYTLLFMCFVPVLYAQNWQLVWQDEFTNGIGPDWVFETGNGGWGNNELQYYRQQNATVENGNLVITAKRESFGGSNYTSARMKTQGRKSWKYGKIEARIAMPSFQGIWPAFWMLGDNISSVGWPSCGEIDIMEHVNGGGQVVGTVHWEQNGHASYSGYTDTNITTYHLYTVEWDENLIKWFVDGVKYHEVNIAGGVNGTSEFHNNFFILLNLAVGGNWPGFNIDNNGFPARMLIDYVRVYQKGVNPPSNGVATVYKHCNYGGYAVSLPEGNYTLGQLQARGVLDNDISSVKVQSGYEMVLYANDNFAGNSIVISGDDTCLVDNNFNDVATSVRVRTITNNSSVLIQAENYSAMNGVQTEPTTDTGGGLNVGYADTGDWMAYNGITFPSSGSYLIEYRVASAVNGAALSADLNAGAIPLGNVAVPNTGGWQNWQTVSHTVNVNAGTYNFGIYIQSSGVNLNWIRITKVGAITSRNTATSNEDTKALVIYPNPVENTLHFNTEITTSKVTIINLQDGTALVVKVKGETLDVAHLKPGVYSIVLENEGKKEERRFIKK